MAGATAPAVFLCGLGLARAQSLPERSEGRGTGSRGAGALCPSARLDVRRQPDSPQQFPKPRIVSHRIEARVHGEVD
jgi:hypothetical protein